MYSRLSIRLRTLNNRNLSNSNDDFFSSFKKRIAEEAAKESQNIQKIKKDSKFRKIQKSLETAAVKYSASFEQIKIKGSEAFDTLKDKNDAFREKYGSFLKEESSLVKFFNKINEITSSLYQKIPDSNNSTVGNLSRSFYNLTFAKYFNYVPSPFYIGNSSKLETFTYVLETNIPERSTKTGIVTKERRGVDWFLNDYILNLKYINKASFFVRNTENPVFLTFFNMKSRISRLLKLLVINKDSIDTYKNIYITNPNFNKENFLYTWENTVIPGLLDAFLYQRNMDLIKKWTTSQCFEFLTSTTEYLDNSNIVPVIVDVYDADIISMKRIEKSSSSTIIIRFSVIFNFKSVNFNDQTKSKYGSGFNEAFITWAIQTDPSCPNSEFTFKVADIGNTLTTLYGVSN